VHAFFLILFVLPSQFDLIEFAMLICTGASVAFGWREWRNGEKLGREAERQKGEDDG